MDTIEKLSELVKHWHMTQHGVLYNSYKECQYATCLQGKEVLAEIETLHYKLYDVNKRR